MRVRLLAMAVALGLLGSAALDAAALEPPNHVELHMIATGPAVESPPKAERLKDACGVAVGTGGRVYVSNYYAHAVYLLTFNETAHAYQFTARVDIPEVPGPPPGGKPVDGPCDLAVDSAGNLYVNDWHRDVVRLAPTSPGATSFEPGIVIDSNHPTGVAVDPVTNHLFIDDRASVAEYEAAPGAGSLPLRRIGLGAIGNGYGVTVSQFTGAAGFPSTAGWVYVADAADGTVKAFDPAESLTVPKQTIDGAGTPQAGFNSLFDTDIAIDSRDGHLYVVDNLQPGLESPEAVVDEFSSLGHYRGPVPPRVASGHPSEIVDAEPSAVAISGLGEVFLSSGNYFNDGTILPDGTPRQDSQIKVFGPAAAVETRIVTASKSGAGSGTVFSGDPSGLRCGTACEGEFPLGRGVTLVAEPAPHSRLVGWTGCPKVLPDGRCSLTIAADVAVAAEFEPVPQQTLSVAIGGSGQGAVASSPAGIECAGTCVAGFDEGSQVTLTATAFGGSVFAGWSGCNAEPAPGSCVVTMSGARAVGAAFTPIVGPPPFTPPPPPPRTLAVVAGGTDGASGAVTSSPGGIDCGATCAGLYADGTTVTLAAHPGAGSAFLGWGGCDSADGTRCTVTLGADKTVAAAFGPGSPGPLKLRGVTVRGQAATLRVAVPAPGELSASSPRLHPASALPVSAGVVALRLRLNGAGARALARRQRVSVPVVLAFTPFDGGTPVKAKTTVPFGSAGKGRR